MKIKKTQKLHTEKAENKKEVKIITMWKPVVSVEKEGDGEAG